MFSALEPLPEAKIIIFLIIAIESPKLGNINQTISNKFYEYKKNINIIMEKEARISWFYCQFGDNFFYLVLLA